MVTTETTLNGILSAWGMDSEPVPAVAPSQVAEAVAPAEPRLEDAGQRVPQDETPVAGQASEEGFGACIGRDLLGNVCPSAAEGARRIVEMCRAYPVRPYLVAGGGRGFATPSANQWIKGEGNWAVVKEFEALWWSEAGDYVVERYADRLPTVCRERCERELPEQVALPE